MARPNVEALFFQQGDEIELSWQRARLLGDDDLAAGLSRAARGTALARHDDRQVADGTLSIYGRALGRAAPAPGLARSSAQLPASILS